MAGITGLGTTFNLPNYHGELLSLSKENTPLLTAAGGIGGGKQTTSTQFEWQSYDLRDPRMTQRLEGADAPTSEARVRDDHDNVVQIFHESISTSYTKQAAVNQYDAVGNGANPVTNEHSWQAVQALKQIARDVNYTFWHSKYNKPVSNAQARQTRGLLQAITTNKKVIEQAETTGASAATDTITVTHNLVVNDKVVFTDVGASTTIRPHVAYWVVQNSTTASFKVSATKGGAPITVGTATVSFYGIKAASVVTPDIIGNLVQSVYENGGFADMVTATLFVHPGQKRAITSAYATAGGSTQGLLAGTRNVGGLNVETLVTDFGTVGIAVDKDVPADAIVAVSLEQIDPVFLAIPGKGVLFEEELAKTGASEKSQIYGEIGLAYGNERNHGVYRGLFPVSA